MKKLILSAVACIVIVLSSCNQNSPAPSPATPTPNPTPTPTSSMTATEALLVGDWIWDKTEGYMNGNIYSTFTPSTQIDASGAVGTNTMYAGSHMVLKSTFLGGTATTSSLSPQFYNADYYSISSISGSWYVARPATGNQLKLSQTFVPFIATAGGNIITLNATTLIIQDWQIGQIPSGHKCFYHK